MSYELVLLRHGESTWNAKNLFTGWVDVDLSDKGRAEAVHGGELLRDAGLLPDVLHTSLLRRAINTANLALDACDRHWIPVRRSWRLNERHYGGLQGKDKKQTLEEYGEEQFMLWRRSFDVPPPTIDDGDEVSATASACSSPPMATACARSSSISTRSVTTTSSASTSPPACRCSTGWTTICSPPSRAASTSTPTLPPLPLPPSPTKVAEAGQESHDKSGVRRVAQASVLTGKWPVTTNTTRLPSVTAWSAIRS
jgi:bisphosphoglycerate-dependent phosphoglycerate mutase